MEAYMAATGNSQIPTTECSQRLKSEEIAQVKNDFRQNTAHLNQMSFIPVLSNKAACHKLPKSKNESENESEILTSERKVMTTYSPPVRPRCAGNNDMLAARIAKTHMRRRSVGFEDMTSLSSYYGHNYSNDRRFQGSVHNSNISQSTENHSTFLQSDNAQPIGKLNQSENMCYTSWNYNAQLSSGENANNQLLQRTERSLQRYKDKSSKRKSSLNRMDFIQFPSPNTGSAHLSDFSQQRNSSSDEGSECRFRTKKAESPSSTTKRKHSANGMNHAAAKPEMKSQEETLRNSSSSKAKSNMLPRSSQTSLPSPRQSRWKPSPTMHFSQKLSHSAGELESITDCSDVPNRNKTYLSAQEFGDQESSRVSFSSGRALSRNNFLTMSPRCLRKNGNVASKITCDITSQVGFKNESTSGECNLISKQQDSKNLDKLSNQDDSVPIDQKENNSSKTPSEQNVSDSRNSDMKLDCDVSEACDVDVETSASKLKVLGITESSSKDDDACLSADESGEAGGSDCEKHPNSILRRKSFDDKKELHSILKPPPEDKFSKTPPSILKHRESSEEKETWQTNDLHSILKKSTSEDESCNSGPDIRPILKLSTDEDSPSGAMRPRPILKKRTSFSDECSYASFSVGELKPILKKKTPLSTDDQPKPILKSRRKSEDTRSTMSEVITSRPRAYSADMGVKICREDQTNNSDVKPDFRKLDSHDL